MRLSRLFVLFIGVAVSATLCAQTGSPAQTASYGAMTRDAIDRIIQANNKVLSGNSDEAQKQLAVIKSSLQALSKMAQQFRDVSVNEYERCKDRQYELNKRISDLYNQQQQMGERIDALNADLAAAATRKSLAEAEIKKLQQSMADTLASLEKTKARLQELEKWWWVPGYGAYLGIRTLADHDIQQYNQSAGALNDQNRQLQANTASLATARTALAGLETDKKNTEQIIGNLKQMRDRDEESLKQFNNMMIFLTTATTFWSKALISADIHGASFVDTMQLLQQLLGTSVETTSFKDPTAQSEVDSFRQKMTALADSIDQHNNFLLSPTTNYCGGPPRSDVAVTTACNISAITQYYEIVDAKTCAFRYLNPPGCPGEPQKASTEIVAVASSRTTQPWSRTQDQNWIGRARCSSTAAIYYGKVSNADQCEQRCRGDASCTTWTFNYSNGSMPNSVFECWGGSRSLSPNKSPWGGFTSGGIQ